MLVKIFRYITSVFFIAAVASTSVAQVPELINNPEFRPHAKAAVDSIYNFNFESADEILSDWEQKYPEHPLWLLFEGMQFWWQVLSDLESRVNDEKFFNMMKKADYAAGKLLHEHPSHPDGLIIKAISNGYMARHYANRNEWISSLNYGREAMIAHEYLLKQQPELSDLKLAEGLKLYYLAYIPEEYPVVKTVSWALPNGDKQKGLELIRRASEEAIFARAEATYFLGNINYNYEHDYDAAVKSFEKLQSQYPHNNYYTRLLVKSYFRQERYDEALQFINVSLLKWDNKDLAFRHVLEEELLTWKGRILEKRGKEEQALECYQQAIAASETFSNTKSRPFYVISNYFAGKILHEQKQFEEAKRYLEKSANADVESGYQQRARNLLAKIQ